MNQEDFHIERMLRESPPHPRPLPGFGTRIHHSLRHPPRQPSGRRGPAIIATAIIAPMVLFGLFGLMTGFGSKSRQSAQVAPTAPPPASTPQPTPSITEQNPLRREAMAIRNDASRAGRFLRNALPSLLEQ